jgi:FkbH-like protein
MPSIVDLPWLAPTPADFSERCAALADRVAPPDRGSEAARLATHALDARQARRLSRTIGKIGRSAAGDLAPLAPVRLVALTNATFDFISDHLPAAAARHGIDLDLIRPPYDQAMQQALDPQSLTATSGADAILLALDHRWYGLTSPALDDAPGKISNAIARLTMLLDALGSSTSATPILCTVGHPPATLFGSFDIRVAGSPRALTDTLNQEIVRLAAERGVLLLDTGALIERVGADHWFDPVQYAAYKIPFGSACAGAYADWVGRLLGAWRGKARKCLVLDLDNTLWGGVVGDDGMDGLVLGTGSPRGEAYLAIQKLALDLKARGVILAVSSKNDDAVARAAFANHPEMALKLDDLAVFQANWQDKASNLEAIAKTLNIGVDALVLLDDNPAERAQLRAALPMVAVPELPDDPAWFPWMLSAAGYFEAVGFSEEDRLRAAAYASDARRAEVMASVRDLGDYLTSLEMRLTAAPFDVTGRTRITQLINKTNQFNVTTRRYSEAQVAAFEADPEVITLQIRLADRFGDLGMIGVVVARLDDASDGVREAAVDSWLMSCRVLGRKIEEAKLNLLAEAALAAGAKRITARYRPTTKNGMVRDLFDRLGMTMVSEDADGGRHYILSLADWSPPTLPHALTGAAG